MDEVQNSSYSIHPSLTNMTWQKSISGVIWKGILQILLLSFQIAIGVAQNIVLLEWKGEIINIDFNSDLPQSDMPKLI